MIGYLYVAPLLVAAALSLLFIAAAVPQRFLPGVRWFMAFEAALVVWTLGYAAELTVPGVDGKLVAAKVQYLGIVFVGIAWLGFTTEHAGFSWWTRRNTAFALVVPVLILALAWTNDLHGWVLSSVELSTGRPYTVLSLGRGPAFWALVVYSYGCLAVALAVLVNSVARRPPPFRAQAGALLMASLFPWVGNVIYVSGRVDLDLTVFGFAAAGFVAGWAILRWKLLSIVPIARDTLVEGMSEPVAVLDAGGRVVDVNPAALRILEREADQVIGRSAPEALGRFAPELGGDAPARRTVKGPGGHRSYDSEVNLLKDAKGRHRGWTMVLHDITERAAEAAALREARRAAEEMALAQRAFLANINHEFRTPLNGVMGMLQVLLHSDLGDEQRGYAETAYASGEELLALVNRVMDFSAIEMGSLDLERVPFELPAVVRRSMERVEGAAAAKGLGLRLEMGPDVPPRVLGDPTRLGQVVLGLLDNAVKFTDEGRVDVGVSVVARGEGDVLVRIEVRDTGVGIPAHRTEAVFQGFVQADASFTRRHQGAGIGLAIAHRLVERMGGTLRVVSEEGRGSTFTCEIPYRTAA